MSDLKVDERGWLQGDNVRHVPMDRSWYSGFMLHGPRAIVAHYSDTDPGTAMAMATHRAKAFVHGDRPASWHVSVEADTVVQMAPLHAVCWHAGGVGSKPIPGVGPANLSSIGIELVGMGQEFPDTQVTQAMLVWRAIVQRYGISRTLAMVQHSALSPGRRVDPGPVWMKECAERVLTYAFA